MSRSPLLTDLYQLTMAAAYRASGLESGQATFELYFRRAPFGGTYALACGLAEVVAFLEGFRFDLADLAYLRGLAGEGGRPLFDPDFLAWLGELQLTVDLDAVPEGTPVFPGEPLLRVTGPLPEAQLLETALLTHTGFASLVATKSSRVCRAAGDAPVLEFGLRRAQGPDGGLKASRAAYIGGAAATSNVLAGQRFGIPVRGTHAHSWVMAHARPGGGEGGEGEEAAFEAWTAAMPHNAILLVDTYDSEAGIDRAVAALRRLRERGGGPGGLRLDSGDLVRLSRLARRRLDEAGLSAARVVASNDLDEHRIRELREAGARIDVWGVGTRLATAYDQPSLGVVYKLTAIRDGDGPWHGVAKHSEDPGKSTLPGRHQARRFRGADGRYVGDVLYDEERGCNVRPEGAVDEGVDLLRPVLREGGVIEAPPSAKAVRELARRELARLPDAVVRLDAPALYRVVTDMCL